MKKLICLLALGFFLMANPLFGEEKKDELQVTVGVKTWYNTWKETWDSGYGSGKGRVVKVKSDPVLAIGPTISFTKGQYFGGISLLQTASDYKNDVTYSTSDTRRAHNTDSISRYDIDGLAGYYFHPRVGGFAGFKYARYKVTETYKELDNSGNVVSTENTDGTHNIYGPVLGLTANYPLGATGLTPFLSLGYVWVRHDDNANPVQSGNFSGPSAELGIAYTFKKVTLTAAYKHQAYYKDNEGGYLKFGGPIFSLNYTF